MKKEKPEKDVSEKETNEVEEDCKEKGSVLNSEALLNMLEDLEKEKKKAQDEKEKSEIIFQLVPSAVFTIDKNKIVTSWNKKAEEITGYKAKEIVGKKCTLFAFFPCNKKCGLYAKDPKKPIIARECIIKSKKGKMITISKNADFLRDSKGKIIGGIESFEDITQNKEIQKELHEAQERFKYALKGTSDGVWDWNIQTNNVYYSAKWKAMLGYKENQIKNDFSEWRKRLHPEDRKRAENYVQNYVKKPKGNFEMEFRMKHKKGHYTTILARAFLVKDEKGMPLRIVGTHIDISQRKKQEFELKQKEERYSSLFDFMPSGVAIYKPIKNGKDFVFVGYNLAGSKMDGVKRDKVIGKSLIKTFPGVKKMGLLKALTKVYKTGKPMEMPFTYYGDKKLQVYRRNHLYKLSTGEVVAIYEDITKQKKLELENEKLKKQLKELKKRKK